MKKYMLAVGIASLLCGVLNAGVILGTVTEVNTYNDGTVGVVITDGTNTVNRYLDPTLDPEVKKTMIAIALTARSSGIPVRAGYLSNTNYYTALQLKSN